MLNMFPNRMVGDTPVYLIHETNIPAFLIHEKRCSWVHNFAVNRDHGISFNGNAFIQVETIQLVALHLTCNF